MLGTPPVIALDEYKIIRTYRLMAYSFAYTPKVELVPHPAKTQLRRSGLDLSRCIALLCRLVMTFD